MRADFVNEVARILDIKRKDLIEKDLILHQILFDLSGDKFQVFLKKIIKNIGPIKIDGGDS